MTPAVSTLDALQARPRRPGEANTFFHDARFGLDAVKLLPGEWFVHDEDILLATTLGSCIAACLWDRDRRIGGMNHFLLPEGDGTGGDPGRYGIHAMELLINELLKRGANRRTLEAKVFGGGQVIAGMSSLNVGERNTRFVLDYLRTERIPVVSSDVLDTCPRKVCFLPASGRAMVKRLAPAHPEDIVAQEAIVAKQPVTRGTVDLFWP